MCVCMCVCVQASFQPLATKLTTLLKETFALTILPELQKKLTKFEAAVNHMQANMVLKRGRR